MQEGDRVESDHTEFSDRSWRDLAGHATEGLQGQGAIIEASRRGVKAQEASERSANQLGNRIRSLNVWLLIFTIAICALTVVLVAVELGWITRPHAAASEAWVLWDPEGGGRWDPVLAFTSQGECLANAPPGTRCLPGTVDPRGPKGAK